MKRSHEFSCVYVFVQHCKDCVMFNLYAIDLRHLESF